MRDTAHATGMSFVHLACVERGEHPLLDTDAVDLGRVLDVPSEWLRRGWESPPAA
jgi:hypothetical protein